MDPAGAERVLRGRRRRAAPLPPLAQPAVATLGGRRLPPRHRQPRRLVRGDGRRSQPAGCGGLWARPPRLGPQRRAARPPGPLRARPRRRRAAGPAGRLRPSGRAGLPGRLELGGQARGRVRRQRPAPLAGLLLLGPGLFPRVNLSPWRWIVVVAGHLVRPMARLPIPLTPELYTANPPYRDFIRADPSGSWRPPPSSSGRRPGSTAAAGQPPLAWSCRCSCSRARTTR